MASQICVQSVEPQEIIQVGKIDPVQVTTNTTPTQPLLTDEIRDVDRGLYTTSRMIEGSRNSLHHIRQVVAGLMERCAAYKDAYHFYETAYNEECQKIQECDKCAAYEDAYNDQCRIVQEQKNAYDALQLQYGKVHGCLYQVSEKSWTLRQELERAQKTIQEYESHHRECNRDSDGNNASAKDNDMNKYGGEPEAFERERLEARIRELEKGKSEMECEHQNALTIAADRIAAYERKIDESATHDSEPAKSPSIDEMASLQPNQSPSPGKRQGDWEEEQEGQVVPRKGGKRRRTMKLKV